LSLFTDCWNIQKNLDSDLFWAGDGRFWGGFPPFCVLAPRIQTCHFFIAPKNCIFWGASFELIKNLATLDPDKLQGFHGTPLCQCYPLHRYEFGPPKFFSKSFKFSIIFHSTWQISGGGQWRKACRSRKKESTQSEITWKQSEPVRSISKIEKRREFVRAMWYEQCPKISFKRLYTLKGLLVLVEKASFLKEFRSEFHSGGGGYTLFYWFELYELYAINR